MMQMPMQNPMGQQPGASQGDITKVWADMHQR